MEILILIPSITSYYTFLTEVTNKLIIDNNEVNIAALEKAVDKLQSDVEKLKDKQRSFANGNDWDSDSFNHVPKRNDDRTHSQGYNEFMP